jgi:hypothetical protein
MFLRKKDRSSYVYPLNPFALSRRNIMALTYEALAAHPRVFLSCTGLTPEEFIILLMDFDYAWQLYEVEQLLDSLPTRQRQPGGGRKATGLARIEEKLLFILMYEKLYPLQSVIGFLFDLSQSQANGWIHTLSALLKSALQSGAYLPERNGSHVADALAATEETVALIDGVERRKQRPTDPDTQQADYSGKKKCHTRKNVIVTTYTRRRVDYLSDTVEGRRHDKPIADQAALTFPDDITLAQDTGFQGYAPANVVICQPKKKPKGQELAPADHTRNTLIARLRIRVEHVIAGIKRCRIVKDVFRNTKHDFDDLVMEIACGLHNFRVECRHWNSS